MSDSNSKFDKALGGEETEKAAVAYTIETAHEAIKKGGDVGTIAFALGRHLVAVEQLFEADRRCHATSNDFYAAVNAEAEK